MSLQKRLLEYLKRQDGIFVPKGTIEKLVVEHTQHTADYAGRTLRLMAEEGTIEVKQVRSGKGVAHSHYMYSKEKAPIKTITKHSIEMVNGMPVAIPYKVALV